MTVQQLINHLITLDLEKEVLVEDKFDGVLGSFNIIENDKDIVISYDGEWNRKI